MLETLLLRAGHNGEVDRVRTELANLESIPYRLHMQPEVVCSGAGLFEGVSGQFDQVLKPWRVDYSGDTERAVEEAGLVGTTELPGGVRRKR